MEGQVSGLLREMSLLSDDASPVCRTIQQRLYAQDGAELQRQFRRLDCILEQLSGCEQRLSSLVGSGSGSPHEQAAAYLARQPVATQAELRPLWGKVRSGLSLLHSQLTGLQLTVGLRQQLLHHFISSIQKCDESVNYSAGGQVQEQAGSGAILNRQV